MEAKVLKYALSRCRAVDFKKILNKWNFLNEEEIDELDLKKPKFSVVNDLVQKCMKKHGMNEERSGDLDLVCNHMYSSKKKWTVYQLQGEQKNSSPGNGSLLSDPRRFRKKLENQMGLYYGIGTEKQKGFGVSVLMMEGAIWLRVYFPPKSGYSYVPSNSVYLVYYPRTPYIIISRVKKSHESSLTQILMRILGYSKMTNMQLTGHHVDSLAELALNRNSQGGFSKYRLNQVQDPPLAGVRNRKRKEPDYDEYDDQIVCEDESVKRRRSEILDETFGPNEQPTLEKLEYRIEVKFRGTINAPGMADKQEPFHCVVKFEGPAILDGIRNLGKCGLATVPLPHHLGGVHSMAKNHFLLADQRPTRQQVENNTSTADQSQSRSVPNSAECVGTPINPTQVSSMTSVQRSTRRYTPFGRTPRTRRLSVNGAVHPMTRTPTSLQKDQLSNLKDLTYKTWKLYQVSPLYNFSCHSRHHRKYSTLLSTYLDEESRKSRFQENQEPRRAIFSFYKGLKVSPEDKEAVQILIRGKSKNGHGEGTVTLTALLCCTGVEESPIHKDVQDSFTYYPVLMVKGPVALTDVLRKWLQNTFDCRVSPLSFSSFDLSWQVAMWSGYLTEPVLRSKPVQLMYSVPSECTGLTKITYTINAKDCKEVWECIHDMESNQFSGDEVATFIKSLEVHFYNLFKVKLTAMSLSRIGTSVAYVGGDGKLKVFSQDHVLRVLRHITELCLERRIPL